MIAYNFKPEFTPDLKTGAKRLTLRRNRKPPSRHAEIGEPIGLWTGMRTKEATRIGVGLVVMRALVRFSADGLGIVSDRKLIAPTADDLNLIDTLLCNRASDEFARLDGFESWAAAWAWHDQARAASERLAPELVRELVAWAKLSDDAAAALDAGARIEDVAA